MMHPAGIWQLLKNSAIGEKNKKCRFLAITSKHIWTHSFNFDIITKKLNYDAYVK